MASTTRRRRQLQALVRRQAREPRAHRAEPLLERLEPPAPRKATTFLVPEENRRVRQSDRSRNVGLRESQPSSCASSIERSLCQRRPTGADGQSTRPVSLGPWLQSPDRVARTPQLEYRPCETQNRDCPRPGELEFQGLLESPPHRVCHLMHAKPKAR